MFELVVYLCLQGNVDECNEWRPYDPYEQKKPCDKEAKRIEDMLVAAGSPNAYANCEPLPDANPASVVYRQSHQKWVM